MSVTPQADARAEYRDEAEEEERLALGWSRHGRKIRRMAQACISTEVRAVSDPRVLARTGPAKLLLRRNERCRDVADDAQ